MEGTDFERFSQNEFNGADDAAVYCEDHATGLKQLRSLADHGNSGGREFLGVMYSKEGKDEGLGLSDDQVSVVSTSIQFSLFASLLGGLFVGLCRKLLRGVEYGWPTTQWYPGLFYTRSNFLPPCLI
jgi:hypothetical protein